MYFIKSFDHTGFCLDGFHCIMIIFLKLYKYTKKNPQLIIIISICFIFLTERHKSNKQYQYQFKITASSIDENKNTL